MAGPALFNGLFTKFLKSQLNLFDVAYVLTGTADPTSVAQNAPQGSIYLRTGASGGTLYTKTDAGSSTNWSRAVNISRSEIYVDGANGHGAVNTTVRRFVDVRKNVGTAITFADTANAGSSFTINETGIYSITYSDRDGDMSIYFGVTVNGSALTTAMSALSYAQGKRIITRNVTGDTNCASITLGLTAGDVVRAQTDGTMDDTSNRVIFSIIQVSK